MNTGEELGTKGAPEPKAIHSARTVLVVEDNDNDAALLKLMFRRSRILNPIQAVTSLQDAICYLKGEGDFADRTMFPFPTLLLVDSHLPDGSGFDLLRWLQQHKALAPLAVVMLTGSDVHAFKTSYDLGAHSFLTKPLKFPDFENMVQGVRGIKLTSTPDGYLLELE